MTHQAKLNSIFTQTDLSRVPALSLQWDSLHLIPSPQSCLASPWPSYAQFEHPWQQTMAFKSTRGYALAGYWADLVMEGKPLSQGETWGQGRRRGLVRRVQADCISLSTFPVQGIYIPYVNISVCICVYLWVCIFRFGERMRV